MIKPQNLIDLPSSPGCYMFKDEQGNVIYVGKAKNLRKRVSNYFQKSEHDEKTSRLISEIKDIDFIATHTEVEALILENNLIKKYYPKYNIDMKDAQKYAYLCLTNDSLPYLETERARNSEWECYGPFVSGALRKLITDVLERNFKIFTHKPSPRYKKLVDKIAYQKRINQARKILKGDVDGLISDLKKEMNLASAKTYYEHALTLKNQINALQSLKHRQLIEFSTAIDSNIINYVISGDTVYLLVFSIRKGVLEGKQEYILLFNPDFLNEFILRYFDNAPIPKEIVIPNAIDSALVEYLAKKSKHKVNIIIPESGDKKQLLELVMKNIYATFFAGREKLLELKNLLNLSKLPIIMECFDISHLGGTNTVASMVSFSNGFPQKSNYRRFKIQSASPSDDYAAMKEVISRRYSGSLSKSMKNPDLIILDGGLPQLSAGMLALKELGLNIPIISLAKKFEEVYIPGKSKPISLPKSNKGLHVLQAIRDEAHRFAINYQKVLRRKGIFGYNGS